jgi:hypothetical protein
VIAELRDQWAPDCLALFPETDGIAGNLVASEQELGRLGNIEPSPFGQPIASLFRDRRSRVKFAKSLVSPLPHKVGGYLPYERSVVRVIVHVPLPRNLFPIPENHSVFKMRRHEQVGRIGTGGPRAISNFCLLG